MTDSELKALREENAALLREQEKFQLKKENAVLRKKYGEPKKADGDRYGELLRAKGIKVTDVRKEDW